MGPTGATGPTGAAGAAATVTVGTVTTAQPGTQATVTNTGTPEAAVLDFTIPQGNTGTAAPVSLLSAYSTPPQSGTNGGALLFDQNGPAYGADLSHTAGSGTFTVNTPGVYAVSFHAALAPTAGAAYPLPIVTTLEQDGSTVPGGTALHTFQSDSDTANVSFSVPVTVATAPSTLQVVGSGGTYLYSAAGMTISRLGDVPSQT